MKSHINTSVKEENPKKTRLKRMEKQNSNLNKISPPFHKINH